MIVEARSCNAALLHSPSWLNTPYIAWMCVLGPLACWKKIMNPLSPAECCGSDTGEACLQFWINHQQCHQQITPTPPHHLLFLTSQREPHVQISSIAVFCIWQRHGGWNQKSEIWTPQTKGQISTGLTSKSSGFFIQQLDSEGLIHAISSKQLMLRCVCYLNSL